MLEPERVLGEMAELGLTATELGPPGYLPTEPAHLRVLLERHGLGLVGGFLPLVLHQNPAAAVEQARTQAALLTAAGAEVLVLAAATGLGGYDERPALTDDEWQTLVRTAVQVRDIAREHGLRAVLHPHVGTHVEREPEVERFVHDSDLPLCLDTGHLLIGGTDPVTLAKRYPERIGHVHLKDVRTDLADRVRAGELGYTEAVHSGLYPPLGDGDVDVEAMVRFVHDAGYDGWYVLEQDTALDENSPPDTPKLDTARSLEYLRKITGRL
ncbi:TIM barrel protein [Herbihabitans rhizosphaerae]|nr:TIM barrel protein [Herbihabitans rhizosphaerae]